MRKKTWLVALTFLLSLGSLSAQKREGAKSRGKPMTLFLAGKITVNGTAAVSAEPDEVLLGWNVNARDRNPKQAFTRVSEKLNRLVSTFLKAGVKRDQIEIRQISLDPAYEPEPDPSAPGGSRVITSYQAGGTLALRLPKEMFSKLGELITLGVSQEASLVGPPGPFGLPGPVFQLSEKTTRRLYFKAFEKAVRDAVTKARAIAQSAGLLLGPVQSLSEREPTNSVAGEKTTGSAPRELFPPSQITRTVSVSMVFQLFRREPFGASTRGTH